MIPAHWTRERERGAPFLLRIMRWIALRLGWHAGWLLLWPITAWFFAASPAARQASRRFLTRATGRPAGPRAVFGHMFVFASVILDRVFLAAGRLDGFTIHIEGMAPLRALAESGRGCLLIGAHLGSFEVLRCLARHSPVPVRPLMYRRNAGALTRLIEQLDPSMPARVIEIGPPDALLRVRESLARGEIVGLLADRAPPGQRLVAVPFLGRDAAFPVGPFQLAAGLAAPVILFWGVRTGRRRYEIHFEPFADPVPVARDPATLAAQVARYAERVAAQCRAHPTNWFSFFDIWDAADDIDRTLVARPGAALGRRGRSLLRRGPSAAQP